MSIIFSVIIISLFYNKESANRIVSKEKQTRPITKLFLDFTVYLFGCVIVGTVIQFPIYAFILKPIKLTSFLLLVMFGMSVGFSILSEYLLKKFGKESLIVFNKYQLAVLVFIGFVLTMQITVTILGSLLLTLLNVLGFFIAGIILIYLSEVISPRIKINDKTSIILITSSILLMVTSVL